MNDIKLFQPSIDDAERIVEYRAEYFSVDQKRVAYHQNRIPGLDYLEKYNDVCEWLQFCESMQDKLTWYMSVREGDGKLIGFCCIRHKLEYDDDDIEFASHIGYSIRPSERRKGYAKRQLHLALQKAKELGLGKVRIICRDSNTGSNRTILANGGKLIDSIYGAESGLTVNRYDIQIG